MTPRLIALCSPAMGSGKSTAAHHLKEAHGFARLAFATPLKSMTVSLLEAAGMPDDEITDRVFGARKEEPIPALSGMTSRRLQQLLGTEFGRNLIDENIWVNITLAGAKSWLELGINVVIDDMRFPNEYHAVIAAGGECYRIVRPDAVVTAAHASEGQLDLVAMPEMWNNGSVDDMLQAVDRLIHP